MDDAFGHWLAGFVDGEGCFAIDGRIRPGHRVPYCQFILCLRLDDLDILECIHSEAGGTLKVRRKTTNPNDKPSGYLRVTGAQELLRVVELFERYPLRAKKARDFVIWAEAVRAQARRPDRRRCKRIDREGSVELTELREHYNRVIQDCWGRLREVRAYSEPSVPLEYERIPK